MQREICNEAPELITLNQLTMKDAVGLLTQTEDRIKGKDGGEGGGAEVERIRNFLTQNEPEQHHKATAKPGTTKVQ